MTISARRAVTRSPAIETSEPTTRGRGLTGWSAQRALHGLLYATVLALLPGIALGSCVGGAAPSYDDIRYVDVRQFSLVSGEHPWYEYQATFFPPDAQGKVRAIVTLASKQGVALVGNYVAVEPIATFERTIAALKAASFFDMRLSPARLLYVDGPEDGVSVVACGIGWTLGTINRGYEIELNDSNARRFFILLDALRKTIFSAPWTKPSPAP